MSALLTYALNEKKELVHIDSVLKGGACKCKCPHCDNWLDAKNGGNIREHHFAHSHGSVCEGAYETTLHLLAKQVLLEEKAIMLPHSEDRSFPTGLVSLTEMEQEKWDKQFNFKPDLEGILPDGRRLLIEIYVSHKVQSKKYETIVANNLLCLEIDLNWVELDKNAIKNYLLNDCKKRRWVTRNAEIKELHGVHGDGSSLSYGRNEWHLKARDFLKGLFDKDTIKLVLRGHHFDLKALGYDVCERRSNNFRGVHSDLLLYRSKYKDKGYISINFRARRRNSEKQLPDNLRVIDIYIRSVNDYNWLSKLLMLDQDSDKISFENFHLKS